MALTACNKTNNNSNVKIENKVSQSTSNPDPITKEDISRLTLRDVRHLMAATKKNKNLDVTNAEKTYEKAEKAFNQGDFEKAQTIGMDAKHQLEKMIIDHL
jgi:hypothetical protein